MVHELKEKNSPVHIEDIRHVIFGPDVLGPYLPMASFWKQLPQLESKVQVAEKLVRHRWLRLSEGIRILSILTAKGYQKAYQAIYLVPLVD